MKYITRFGALELQRVFIIGFFLGAIVMALSGCSATSALTGLVGSKPDMSAQVGAENTKQGVGLNNKVDASSKAESTIKDSAVGKVDSSSGKKASASSITAETIKADKIEIHSGGDDSALWKMATAFAFALLISALAVYYLSKPRNKGA